MPEPMKLLRARYITLLTVAIAACGSDEAQSLDPTATYDVYGQRFEPGIAVPAPAVIAEPDVYVGKEVIVEGVAADGCLKPACLAGITPIGGGRINVILDSEEGGTFATPGDVSGRRIVVSGRLEEGGSSAQAAAGAADARSAPDERIPTTADTLETEGESTFDLYATGIMVEKVRP